MTWLSGRQRDEAEAPDPHFFFTTKVRLLRPVPKKYYCVTLWERSGAMSDPKQSVFDSRDLAELHRAYLGTCEELGLRAEGDAERRKGAAALIMQMAISGEKDPAVLKQRAVYRVALLLEGAEHPTQKPVEIMQWSLEWAEKFDAYVPSEPSEDEIRRIRITARVCVELLSQNISAEGVAYAARRLVDLTDAQLKR